MASGSHSLINRSAWGNKSRSSCSPSCLPAMENGGQGTPPDSKSTCPTNFFALNSLRSFSITFQSGRFCRMVWQAKGSISTKAICAKPASSNPSACPPAPAHISKEVKLCFVAFFFKTTLFLRVLRIAKLITIHFSGLNLLLILRMTGGYFVVFQVFFSILNVFLLAKNIYTGSTSLRCGQIFSITHAKPITSAQPIRLSQRNAVRSCQ